MNNELKPVYDLKEKFLQTLPSSTFLIPLTNYAPAITHRTTVQTEKSWKNPRHDH